MTTQTVKLTRAWTQVTTGSETVAVSLASGQAMVFDSATAPAADANGHLVTDWINITPPTVAWMRATGLDAAIIKS